MAQLIAPPPGLRSSHLQNQRLLRSLHSRIASLESELQEANSKLGAAGATPASFGIDHTPSSSSADFDDQMTSLNAGDSPESKDDSPCTSQEHAAGASYSEGGVLRMNAAGGPLYIGRSGGALYTSGGQLCSVSVLGQKQLKSFRMLMLSQSAPASPRQAQMAVMPWIHQVYQCHKQCGTFSCLLSATQALNPTTLAPTCQLTTQLAR